MDRKTLLLITFIAEGGLILLGLVLMRSSGEGLCSRIDLSWRATACALLFCAPLLVALNVVIRSRWSPLSHLNRDIEEKVMPIFANCKTVDLVLIALLAGVGEELFFRGWLQGLLTGKFGVWAGILVVSAVFGCAHYLSASYALYAGLTGIYLGIVYQAFGDLYIVMFIHAFYNFIALVLLVGRSKGKEAGLQANG
jgi:membrane protease YdiL (CAAX protease family)